MEAFKGCQMARLRDLCLSRLHFEVEGCISTKFKVLAQLENNAPSHLHIHPFVLPPYIL